MREASKRFNNLTYYNPCLDDRLVGIKDKLESSGSKPRLGLPLEDRISPAFEQELGNGQSLTEYYEFSPLGLEIRTRGKKIEMYRKRS